MKLAVGILCLVFMLIEGAQSILIGITGAIGQVHGTGESWAMGTLISLGFLFGGAFAFKLPTVSAVILGLFGLTGVLAGNTTAFTDLRVWGVLQLIFCALSIWAAYLTRRKRMRNKVA